MKTKVLLTISVFVLVLFGAFILCNQFDNSTDRDNSQALKNLDFDSALVKGTSNEEGNPDGADRKRNTDRRMMTKGSSNEEGNPDGADRKRNTDRRMMAKGTSNEEGNPDGADRQRNTDRRMMT